MVLQCLVEFVFVVLWFGWLFWFGVGFGCCVLVWWVCGGLLIVPFLGLWWLLQVVDFVC